MPEFLTDPLQLAGTITGLACVWLLIIQNVWTWPIGLVYAVVSTVMFYQVRLYADVGLHVVYVAMNAYGWYYWTRRGRDDSPLVVTRTPLVTLTWLAGLSVVLIGLLGFVLGTYTDADLVYWDSTTTILSFVAMWMTARKYIESWPVWLFVDVLAVGIYAYKGIAGYVVLYAVYLGMAVIGYRTWRETLKPEPSFA